MNHFCLSLATEVPEISAVSIRPGVVDTQMQKEIRTAHVQAMGEGNQRFQNFHKDGKLLRYVVYYPVLFGSLRRLRGLLEALRALPPSRGFARLQPCVTGLNFNWDDHG
jgi:hypothetical protein